MSELNWLECGCVRWSPCLNYVQEFVLWIYRLCILGEGGLQAAGERVELDRVRGAPRGPSCLNYVQEFGLWIYRLYAIGEGGLQAAGE